MEQKTEEKATSGGEEKDMSTVLEEALKSVGDLTKTLADRTDEIESLHALAADQEKKFEDEKTELLSKIEELSNALEAVVAERDSASAELASMREEAMLKSRFEALNSLGLLRSNESAQIKQGEKIKAMSDEEFSIYIEELKDIREQALASTPDVKEKKAEKEVEPSIDAEAAAEAIVKSVDTASTDDEAQSRIKKILETLNLNKPTAITVADEGKEEETANDETETEGSKEVASSQKKLDVTKLANGLKSIAYYKNK